MKTELNLMLHAVGMSDNWQGPWRNHFCASPLSQDDMTWRGLVAQGDAILIAGPSATYPYRTYSVTEQGLGRIRHHIAERSTEAEKESVNRRKP